MKRVMYYRKGEELDEDNSVDLRILSNLCDDYGYTINNDYKVIIIIEKVKKI